MPDSASGVSTTPASPKSFCRPSVTRKTPPSLPTSSPMIRTLGSSSMALRRPSFSALDSVRVAIGLPPRRRRSRGRPMTTLTLSRALNEGLRKAMEDDPKVLIMGEDVGKLGGVFRVTDGLQKDFGEARVVDTPLAESGIVGTAIGLALRGYRPVCEIQFDGFVYPAYDQIVSQLAKMHYRSQGTTPLPVTIRIPFGGGVVPCER